MGGSASCCEGPWKGFAIKFVHFRLHRSKSNGGNTACINFNEERILACVLCQIDALFLQDDADLDLLVAFWRENKASYEKELKLLIDLFLSGQGRP